MAPVTRLASQSSIARDVASASTSASRLVLRAGLFVLIEFLAINGALALFHQESVFDHLGDWLTMDASADSWWPMRNAHEWLNSPHTGTLYQEIFFKQQLKFQYSPTSLLPFVLTDRLGIWPSFTLFNAISWGFVVVELVAVAALALLLGKRFGATKDDWCSRSFCAGFAALSCIVFYPVMKAFTLGQVQTWINACFALACVCWFTERKAVAGILIGAICLLKPQFSLFLIWGGLRREWRFLVGWSLIVLPGLAVSIHEFGIANHLDYINVLEFISRHGEAYYANHTVNGLLNRLLGNGDNLHWHEHDFAPFNPVVYAGTLITSGTMVLSCLFWRARSESANLLDFLIAGLSFTMASPIGWEHHFGILPPAFVAVFFILTVSPSTPSRRALFTLLGAGYLLGTNYFAFVQVLAATPFNFVQSYLMFGALIVLGLLYRLRDTPFPRSGTEMGQPMGVGAAG